MPMRIGVPPLRLPRRRLSLLNQDSSDPGPPGFDVRTGLMSEAPPVPTDRFEDDRNPPDPTIQPTKTDWFSMLLKLAGPALGLAFGGKKGLAYGTQFSTGFIDEERKIRGEQETTRERQSLASDRRSARAKEQRQKAAKAYDDTGVVFPDLTAEDKAKIDDRKDQERLRKVDEKNEQDLKEAAKESARVAEKNADMLKDLRLRGDTEGVNYTVNADPNNPQGLLAPRGRVEQKPGEMTPRARASIGRLGSGARAGISYQTLIIDGKPHKVKVSTDAQGNVISKEDLGETTAKVETPKEKARREALARLLASRTTDPDTTNSPPLAPKVAPADTTGGRQSMAGRPTGAPTVRPQGPVFVEDAARIKRLMGKINPDTGQNFTESEAIAFIAKNK